MLNGFDVSGNAGAVNFAEARAAGYRFCFARVGRGVPSSATDAFGHDTWWPRYRAAARAAGLLLGGYWRFYPVSVGYATQVDRFAEALGQSAGMLAPLVDVEDAEGLTPTQLTDWTIRTLDAVRDATGRTPILYPGNRWFLANALQGWRLDRWVRCLAAETSTWVDHCAVFQQYNLDTGAPWAVGNVDLQWFAARDVDLVSLTYEHDLRYFIDDDGQLYGPRAVWRPLPEGQDERNRQVPRRHIIHTEVGSHEGTDAYFRRTDVGVESTVIIAGRYDGPSVDGEIRQLVECDVIANANLEGDRDPADCTSAENSDGSNATYPNRWQEPFSPRQADSNWQFAAAVCWRYGVTPAALPDSCEGRSGIGWHRLGIKGNWTRPYPYSGWRSPCDVFSLATGKPCPGDARINQIYTVGMPTVTRIVGSIRNPTTPPPPSPDLHDRWETTMDPITVRIANTDPVQYAYVCPDGLVVGPLGEGAAGISAFQQLYAGAAVNLTQIKIVQNLRRLAQFGVPVEFDLGQTDVDQLATAFAVALQAVLNPPVVDPPPQPPT